MTTRPHIHAARQVADDGTVRYVVTRDGIQLGEVAKRADGGYAVTRPGAMPVPVRTLADGIDWLHIHVTPSPEVLSAAIRRAHESLRMTRSELQRTNHARRKASLRNDLADTEALLSRLVTELGAAHHEARR